MTEITKGVYRITHIDSGTTYIGRAARSFRIRWINHKSDLRRGVHSNRHLQCAWNKYGEDAFEFIILESIDSLRRLEEREQFWLDTYRARGSVYNVGMIADKPTLGYNHTEEAKRKMSAAHKGVPLSEEHKHNIGKANKGRPNPMLGCKRTQETRYKISEALVGRKLSAQHCLAISRVHKGMKMPPFTKEHRRKLSKASAKSYPAFIHRLTGEIIPKGFNLRALCRERNLSAQHMWQVVHEIRKSHKDWVLYTADISLRIG